MLHCLEWHGEIASLGQLIGEHEHDALIQRGAEGLDHFRRHKVPVDVGEGARIIDDAARVMSHGYFSGSVLLHKLAVLLRNAICRWKVVKSHIQSGARIGCIPIIKS